MKKLTPENTVSGRNPVLELIKHKPHVISIIYVAKGSKRLAELEPFSSRLSTTGVEIAEISRSDLDRILGTKNHQGIAALIIEQSPSSLEQVVENSLDKRGTGIVVALDQIGDPQNMGAIFRAAESSGVDGIIIPHRRSAPVTSVVRKASAGASELVPYCEVTNLCRTLGELKGKGFWIIGTGITENSLSLYESKMPNPLVLVLGSEGKGLRPLIVKECDLIVEIPMQGKVESLNVSQAASVVLFELVRRRLGRDR